MVHPLKKEYEIPQGKKIRLEGICDDITMLIQCINYLGLQDFKKNLTFYLPNKIVLFFN